MTDLEDSSAVVRRLSAEIWRLEEENKRLRDRIDQHHSIFEPLRFKLELSRAHEEHAWNAAGQISDDNERLRDAIRDAWKLIDNELVGPWIMAHKLDGILGLNPMVPPESMFEP